MAYRRRTASRRTASRRAAPRRTVRSGRSTRRVSRGSRGSAQTVRLVIEQAPANPVARTPPDMSMIGKTPAPAPHKAKF